VGRSVRGFSGRSPPAVPAVTRGAEIFASQIRVTPFFWEKTARQIERYGMPEIYAFSTDFPHPEGGTDPIGRMGADISQLGSDAVEAFFVGNASLLLPT
jgi:hypothetical protein